QGISTIRRSAVPKAFSIHPNRRSFTKLRSSRTSAVAALISMMTGDSTRTASANATPWAARLNVGSGSRAMTDARNGPSDAIITHVAARGSQKKRIERCDGWLNLAAKLRSRHVPRFGGTIGVRGSTADPDDLHQALAHLVRASGFLEARAHPLDGAGVDVAGYGRAPTLVRAEAVDRIDRLRIEHARGRIVERELGCVGTVVAEGM